MQVTIPHAFGKDEAIRRVKLALDEARTKIGEQATIDTEEWQDDTLLFGFTAHGQSISGTLEVRDKEFELNARLPVMLRMFESKIQKAIEEQASRMLQ